MEFSIHSISLQLFRVSSTFEDSFGITTEIKVDILVAMSFLIQMDNTTVSDLADILICIVLMTKWEESE